MPKIPQIKPKNKRGRGNKAEVDSARVIDLAQKGNSNRDIAVLCGCDEGTIRVRFKREIEMGRSLRRSQLREWQWKAASAGDKTMLVWLGKNDLDQVDRQDNHHTGEVDVKVVYA